MLRIVAVGVVRESRKFSGHPCNGMYRAHCAVIFAIAQLSCLNKNLLGVLAVAALCFKTTFLFNVAFLPREATRSAVLPRQVVGPSDRL